LNVVACGLEKRALKPWDHVNVKGSRGNDVATLILSKNADIICLEEVSRFEELSVFLKEFGYEGVCCLKAEPVMLKLDRDGVAIFWKIERFKCKGVLRMEKVENWNQVCMCCLLENEKRKIAVAVTHLKATQKEFLEELRCRQVLEFTKRYDDWLIHEKPDLTLFVGDLNSTPGNKAWKGLALASLEQRGYKSSWHVFFLPKN